MKAMVLDKFEQEVRWKDVPNPVIGSQDVLVRVKANGLCATDLKIVDGAVPTVKLPHILGHEVAGEVAGAVIEGLADIV